MPGSGFRGSPRQLWKAFCWSMKGLRAAWCHEASFRLEVLLALVLVPAGLWLGHDGLERVTLVVPIFMGLATELVNSALEALVDLVSPGFHELAGRVKELGSAAVFVLQLATLLCWLLVLGPYYG